MGCCAAKATNEPEDSSTTLPLGIPLKPEEETPSPVRRLSKVEVRESRYSLAKSQSTERFRLKKEQEQNTVVVANPIPQSQAGVADITSVGFDVASREFTKDRPINERKSRRNLHGDITA